MKTINNILVCLSAVLFAGCVEAELIETQEPSVVIEAAMESEIDTRTSLSGLIDGMYYPLWSEGDEIAVYVDGDRNASKFSLSAGAGTTISEFSGTRSGDNYLALYPYQIAGSNSEGFLHLTLPQEQEYVADSFGPDAFPMIATGTHGSGLKFRNLGAVLKVSMSGKAAIRSITVTANDEAAYLSGPASVATDYDDEPEMVMFSEGSPSVTLHAKGTELSQNQETDFYIVIPAQTYKGGLTLTIDAYNDVITKVVTSDITFGRSEVRAIRNIVLDVDVPNIMIEALLDNEIWYVSEGELVVPVSPYADFGASVVSNTYEDGKGVIRFDGAVTRLSSQMLDPFYADKITEVYLPKSITSITGNPLMDCQNLTAIYGELATSDNKSLVLDGTLHSVATHGMEEYVTPEGVKKVSANAIYKASDIKKVVISEGVYAVGDNAVAECPELEEIHLPSTLEKLDGYGFSRNPKVRGFYGDSPMITDDNLALTIDNYNGLSMKALVLYASGSQNTSYSIPDDVTLIESYAFYRAENLREVNFHDNVTFASGSCFEETYSIERITGPDVAEDGRSLVVDGELRYVAPKGLVNYTTPASVEKLGYGALSNKPELETIIISDNVKAVGSAITCKPYEVPLGYVMHNCPNLKSVTISANMLIMGMDPFGMSISNIPDKLESVYLRAAIPPILGANHPEEIPTLFEDMTVYVPESSLQAYLASPDWEPYRGYMKGYEYSDLPENDVYVSTDFSKDGEVVTIQTATKGNGIDIILMGDAYTDRQMSDGFYKRDMELLYDNLFTEEPFRSYSEYFNVYYVNVISATEGYEYGNTALDTWFGKGTEVGGTDKSAMKYALKAITEDRMDEAMIIVAMNSDAYAGTCYMYYPENFTDYGSGLSISYFPRGGDDVTFARLLHHEANGHGFAKLADEYAYDYKGEVTVDERNKTIGDQSNRGWWKNVDFTGDPSKVRWSYFLEDERYANEGLGVYEGGLTYWTGVWRPTETSIMVNNTGGFNAPSREAIYYRINKLAHGGDWEYDYEEFVEYDEVNRSASSSSEGAARRRRSNYVEADFVQPAPPIVVGRSWRDQL